MLQPIQPQFLNVKFGVRILGNLNEDLQKSDSMKTIRELCNVRPRVAEIVFVKKEGVFWDKYTATIKTILGIDGVFHHKIVSRTSKANPSPFLLKVISFLVNAR